MLKEEWSTIKYKGLENYTISNYGKIAAKDREGKDGRKLKRQMMNTFSKNGKTVYLLSTDGTTHGYIVARLVAYTFIGKPQKDQIIIHKDGNDTNNHVNNLVWASRLDSLINNKKAKGQTIRKVQAFKDGKTYTFNSMLECCRQLNLKAPNVSNCLNDKFPNRIKHHGYTFKYIYVTE